MFRFDSRQEYFKSPFGAVPNGSKVRYRVQAKDGVFVSGMYVVVAIDDGERVYYPMQYEGKDGEWSSYVCEVEFGDIGLYWYNFHVVSEYGVFDLYKGTGDYLATTGSPYQLTVYDKKYTTPDKIKGGVIYHIFVDRFNKGEDPSAVWCKDGVLKDWHEPVTIVDTDGVFRANDFYGGNLQGIIDKLDYLKSLGVTMLYLSPIFKSSSNHRYDTGDYMQIDELLGSEESFDRLVAQAKKKGIGIILDGVFNHTGSDSLYFNKFGHYDSVGAYQSRDSKYYDWYSFSHFPNDYACWWGITVTPTVNKTNANYRRFILGKDGVLDKWTNKGIAGWRLDVVDELDIDFVNGIRDSVKSIDKKKVIIGEVWEDASNKVAYSKRRPYLLGGQLDGVMNYPFKIAVIDFVRQRDVEQFVDRVMSIYENYPLQALNCCMNFLGTHDTVRAINSLSDHCIDYTSKYDRLYAKLNDWERRVAKDRLELATCLQYILPGVPSIFYGDEVGLEGYEDPINRKPFPWNDMDQELLEHYRALGKMRAKHKKAFSGGMRMGFWQDLLCIEREGGGEKVVLLVNPNDRDICLADFLLEKQVLIANSEDRKWIKAGGYVIFCIKNA